MIINLWVFLTAAVAFTALFLIIVASNTNKKKLKELEIEALKIERDNLDAVVEEAVKKVVIDLSSRIEVLEAIVTDKKYDLNEEITNLK
ncbi:MAG: hypothetical protein HRT53_16410 [Colwellia sp.]|nr:hypothetical protein [Colwellia sp.]